MRTHTAHILAASLLLATGITEASAADPYADAPAYVKPVVAGARRD